MSNEHQDKAEQLIGSFNSNDREDIAEIKQKAKDLVESISKLCPKGRRQSHAFTNIETAAMFAVKSLFEG